MHPDGLSRRGFLRRSVLGPLAAPGLGPSEPSRPAWIIVALGWEYNDEFTFPAGESPQPRLFSSREAAEAECRRLCDEFFAAQTPQEFRADFVEYDGDPATATWSDLRAEGFPDPYYVMELCP